MWTLVWGQQGRVRHFWTFREEQNQIQPRLSAFAASPYSPPLLSKHKLSADFLEFPEHGHKLFPHLLCTSSMPSLAWLPLSSCSSSFTIASSGPAPLQWEPPNKDQHTSYLGLQGCCQARSTSRNSLDEFCLAVLLVVWLGWGKTPPLILNEVH